MLKQLFLSVAVVGLTACGTSSGGSTSNCKEITPFITGGKSKFERTLSSGQKFINYRETLESSEEILRQTLRIESPGVGVLVEVDTENEFYIKKHYAYTTKRVIKTSATGMGTQNTTEIFDPHSNRLPWDRACKGDKWEDTFTVKLGTSESNMTTRLKVEDVSVEKTVEAGTFDTYILAFLSDDSSVEDRMWFDMDTGAIVYTEGYDVSGKVESSGELLEYTD